jgi:hypothetical protein
MESESQEGTGDVVEEEDEEEGHWNMAYKKYQEFQQACADILDPGMV